MLLPRMGKFISQFAICVDFWSVAIQSVSNDILSFEILVSQHINFPLHLDV